MNTHFPSLDFDLGEEIEMLRESVYQFARLESEGYGQMPVCMAKGQPVVSRYCRLRASTRS